MTKSRIQDALEELGITSLFQLMKLADNTDTSRLKEKKSISIHDLLLENWPENVEFEIITIEPLVLALTFKTEKDIFYLLPSSAYLDICQYIEIKRINKDNSTSTATIYGTTPLLLKNKFPALFINLMLYISELDKTLQFAITIKNIPALKNRNIIKTKVFNIENDDLFLNLN